VHRDVKPSNVIFVGGVAKLADIGLVAAVSDSRSFVGTEGYIPPEGPGTASADCYALGKLLYELSTGHDRTAWPEPSADLATRPDRERLLELNAILHKACAPDVRERYANGEAMQADLDLLQRGQSVQRRRAVERRAASAKKTSLAVGSILVLAAIIWLAAGNWTRPQPDRSAPPASTDRFAVLAEQLVAVGSFTAEGTNTEDAALASSMRNEFIARLEDVTGSKLVRTNSQALATAGEPAWAAARPLNVRAVLEGNLHFEPGQVFLSARLLSAADGRQLWFGTNQCERAVAHHVYGWSSLVPEVLQASLTLLPRDRNELKQRLQPRCQALDHFLKGRNQSELVTREGLSRAIASFNRAVELYPGYARAYLFLAWNYSVASDWHRPPHEAMSQAREAVLSALRIDDTLAWGHVQLGLIKWQYDWDWAGAEQEFKQVILRRPNDFAARAAYAELLQCQGRLAEAAVEAKLALESGPFWHPARVVSLWQLCLEHRYEEALALVTNWLRTNTNSVPALSSLAPIHERMGRHTEAIEVFQKLRAIDDAPDVVAALGYNLGKLGQREQALEQLKKLNDLAPHTYLSPVFPATIYAGLGDTDQALGWLEKACDQKSGAVTRLKIDYHWDALHSEPRFIALVKRIGLEK
jgi:tetratricopeptide (TPR) repeat protein